MRSEPTKPKLKSDRIAAEIATKQHDQADATAELARLREDRPAMLRTATDDDLEAHDRKIAKAARAIERAAVHEADLVSDLASALASEEQGRRLEVYAAAAAAAAEYRRVIEKEYVPAARKVAAVLTKMRELYDAAWFSDLPDGKAPIDARAFRDAPPPAPPEKPRMLKRSYWRDGQGTRVPNPVLVNGEARGFTEHTELYQETVIPGRPVPHELVPSIEHATRVQTQSSHCIGVRIVIPTL